MRYTRLKKPEYLVTVFPMYSLSSPYFGTASSDAKKPKICLNFYNIKKNLNSLLMQRPRDVICDYESALA
jgi:hypothetical protein